MPTAISSRAMSARITGCTLTATARTRRITPAATSEIPISRTTAAHAVERMADQSDADDDAQNPEDRGEGAILVSSK